MKPDNLGDIIKKVRIPVVAKACGVTPRAIYKWINSGSLPRTDYTSETEYASKIAEASGGQFTTVQILAMGKPKVT